MTDSKSALIKITRNTYINMTWCIKAFVFVATILDSDMAGWVLSSMEYFGLFLTMDERWMSRGNY